jgi:hypothetical protein
METGLHRLIYFRGLEFVSRESSCPESVCGFARSPDSAVPEHLRRFALKRSKSGINNARPKHHACPALARSVMNQINKIGSAQEVRFCMISRASRMKNTFHLVRDPATARRLSLAISNDCLCVQLDHPVFFHSNHVKSFHSALKDWPTHASHETAQGHWAARPKKESWMHCALYQLKGHLTRPPDLPHHDKGHCLDILLSGFMPNCPFIQNGNQVRAI